MRHNIIMPDLGQTSAEGKVVRWLKRPGDRISKGDALLEVETDKVTMDVEAYRAGYLRSLLVKEGEMASAMAPIAILTDEAEEPLDDAGPEGGKSGQVSSEEREAKGNDGAHLVDVPEQVGPTSTQPDGRVVASPAAKKLAGKLGIGLAGITGSGPEGLITARDIDSASTRKVSRPVQPMAELTSRSAQTIPHFYVTVEVEVGPMLRWRENWNRSHPDLGASVNDILVRMAALALKDVPELNVFYRDGRIEPSLRSDILLVVATSSGLTLVPVAEPDHLPWEDYLKQVRKVLLDAREKRNMDSRSGRSPALAVSNLGMHGVKEFTAIIPPGSTAVLSVGAVRESIIVRNRQMKFAEVCSLTLASDHRVVDGVTAARFLERFQVHLNSL